MHTLDSREIFKPFAALGKKKLPEVASRRRQGAVRAMGDTPLAFKWKALHVEHPEQAGAHFGLNRLC
jgi:hypothetical protein